jgi:hypothetical protein
MIVALTLAKGRSRNDPASGGIAKVLLDQLQ